MTFEEIERLVRLVAGTDLSEVEVKRSGVHVRICRGRGGTSQVGEPSAQSGSSSWVAAAPATAGETAAAAPPPPAAKPRPEDEGLHVITATMVGTFYRRPNPESPPFVKEGDTVKKGQVICILEAMKILNEIECDVSGTVVKVFAEDAQPVEYGEKLLSIRPA